MRYQRPLEEGRRVYGKVVTVKPPAIWTGPSFEENWNHSFKLDTLFIKRHDWKALTTMHDTASWGLWKHSNPVPGGRPRFFKPEWPKESKNGFKTISCCPYRKVIFSNYFFKYQKSSKNPTVSFLINSLVILTPWSRCFLWYQDYLNPESYKIIFKTFE